MVQADGIIANADKVDDLDGPIVCYTECLCPPTPLATSCDWRRHAFEVFFDMGGWVGGWLGGRGEGRRSESGAEAEAGRPYGQPWRAMAGHAWPWQAMAGHG